MTKATRTQYQNSDFMSPLFLSSLLDPLHPLSPKLEVRETRVTNLTSPFIAPVSNFPSASVGPGTLQAQEIVVNCSFDKTAPPSLSFPRESVAFQGVLQSKAISVCKNAWRGVGAVTD